jgi:hypothetical protein
MPPYSETVITGDSTRSAEKDPTSEIKFLNPRNLDYIFPNLEDTSLVFDTTEIYLLPRHQGDTPLYQLSAPLISDKETVILKRVQQNLDLTDGSNGADDLYQFWYVERSPRPVIAITKLGPDVSYAQQPNETIEMRGFALLQDNPRFHWDVLRNSEVFMWAICNLATTVWKDSTATTLAQEWKDCAFGDPLVLKISPGVDRDTEELLVTVWCASVLYEQLTEQKAERELGHMKQQEEPSKDYMKRALNLFKKDKIKNKK